MSKHRSLIAIALVAAALPLAGCHKAKEYETTVEVTRVSALGKKDEKGSPSSMDVELSYSECPGTQVEVLRGGKDFAACAAKLKVGDKVKVKLEHHWDVEGHWDYDVFEVGGCQRPPDPNDEASYKMVRDCADWNVNGTRVGFQCNYSNKTQLNEKCPWFKTH